MTTAPAHVRARRLDPGQADRVVRFLEQAGDATASGTLRHQQLLIALDRGNADRFVVWPPERPAAVLYLSGNATVVPAGAPDGAAALTGVAERSGWRVLIGDAVIGGALLSESSRGLFRRRPYSREQRFMVALPGGGAHAGAYDRLRPARLEDVDVLTDFACRLHVEDLMGPPITGSARQSVRVRMREGVEAGTAWVAEHDGRVVAKIDIALRSDRRGAQLAGVYVDEATRGRGIGGGAVSALAGRLLDEGLPGVTLHVRADNASGIAAYRRAGFVDAGAWILALR